MPQYQFNIIVGTSPLTDDQILEVADGLAAAGCLDASVRGHALGLELLFTREADSLQAAITSAVRDVERAGYSVLKVELARETIPT